MFRKKRSLTRTELLRQRLALKFGLARQEPRGELVQRRAKESLALLAVGDGVIGAVYPERHTWLWRRGPKRYATLMDWFLAHPTATRTIAMAEVGLGLWAAKRQQV